MLLYNISNLFFQYSFGDDLMRTLLLPLELELQRTQHTYCGRIYKVFIKQLTKSTQDIYDRRSKGRWSFQTLQIFKLNKTDVGRICEAIRIFMKETAYCWSWILRACWDLSPSAKMLSIFKNSFQENKHTVENVWSSILTHFHYNEFCIQVLCS